MYKTKYIKFYINKNNNKINNYKRNKFSKKQITKKMN